MSLWIRSQDKSALVKTDNVLYNIEEMEICCVLTTTAAKISLGKYNSEKRIMEIMDDIQSKMFNPNRVIVQTQYPCKKEDKYKVQMDFESLNGIPAIVHDITPSVTPMNQEVFIYEMPEK